MNKSSLIGLLGFVVAIASLGMVGWVVTDPQRWLSDVYERQSDLDSRISDVESGSDDLDSRIYELEVMIEDQALEIDDLRSSVETMESTVQAICDELSYYDGAFAEIYAAAC